MRSNHFIGFFILWAMSCASGSAAVPVILNWSQSAGIGEDIYVQGANFGARPVLQYSYNDANWKLLESLGTSNGVIVAQLPANETRLPDILTVRVSGDNGSTWSASVLINQSQAAYFDTDQISAGSAFQVFGRNLCLGRTPAIRFVDTSTGISQQATVSLSGSTNYLLRATAPAGIVAGHTYKVFTSNGYSGNSSTIVESLAAEMLTGRTGGTDNWQLGTPWAADFSFYANTYNVKTDSRLGGLFAVGNGTADDTWPIMHAIQVAYAAGGGVVFLPPGTYTLHIPNGCAMQLLPKVVVAGSDQKQVTINYGYPVSGPGGYGVCFANYSGLANLTLQSVDTAQHWQWSGLSTNNSEVFLKNVTWNVGTSQWLVFQSDDHVAIEDSTINQGLDNQFANLGPLDMSSCAHCQVLRSNIQFVVGGVNLDGATDMIFQGNKVVRDISSSPDPSTVTHLIAANFVSGFGAVGNSFSSVGGGEPTNNDGETINTEGGGGTRYDEFRGTVTAASATSITDSSQNFLSSPNTVPGLRAGIAAIAIVTGNAMGQVRKITSVTGSTVGIDAPWTVQPEIGSHYATFDWSAEHWILANNIMTGNFKGIEFFNASARDVLLQSNTLTDSDGIMVSPSEAPAGSAGALFNVIVDMRVIGNTIKDVSHLHPAFIAIVPREDQQTEAFGTQIIGAEVKSNIIVGSIPNTRVSNSSWDDYKVSSEGLLNLYYWQSNGPYASSGAPPLLATVFQSNSMTNSTSAFVLNSGATATLLASTYARNAGQLIQDEQIQGAAGGSVGSVNSGQISMFPIGPVSSTAADIISPVATTSGMRAIEMGHQGAPRYAINDGSDTLNLLGMEMGSDGIVLSKVNVSSGSTATGLLMMRSTPTAASTFVSVGLTSGNINIQHRSANGGTVQTSSIPFSGNSAVFQLVKHGSSINAMYSEDGVNWATKPIPIAFSSRVYLAGIGIESDGTSNESEASFEGFTIAPASTQLVTTGGNRPLRPVLQTVKTVRNWVLVVWHVVWHSVRRVI